VNPSIAAARAMTAAALASAEATNAAVAAILRTRAMLEKHGMAEPRREDQLQRGADPRRARGEDELLLRRALLRVCSPALWAGAPADAGLPRALRAAPVIGAPEAVGFPLGQHLGCALLLPAGPPPAAQRALVLLVVCGPVRIAAKMRLCEVPAAS
jgi:hypothetical protein